MLDWISKALAKLTGKSGKPNSAVKECPLKKDPSILVQVVRSSDKQVMEDVEVNISGAKKASKKTAKNSGIYIFDKLKEGQYDVAVNIQGRRWENWASPPVHKTGDLRKGSETHVVVLAIKPPGSLQVQIVCSDNKEVVAGAKVHIEGPATYDKPTASGSGMATFDRIKAGEYSVKITLPRDIVQKYRLPDLKPKLVKAGDQSVLQVKIDPRVKVNPTMEVEKPKIVLVKRPYMEQVKHKVKPHRIAVRLGTNVKFDGTGRLLCNQPGKVKIYDARDGGSMKNLPLPISTAELNKCHDQPNDPHVLYIEGLQPSASTQDIELTLELQGGTSPVGDPVTEKLTCVRLKLDICKCRTSDAADPAVIPEADKIEQGRYVHEQNTENQHERAMLIVHQAEPRDYQGELSLIIWDTQWDIRGRRIQLFETEQPADGQAAKSNPYNIAHNTIPAGGIKLWVQGDSVSEELQDMAIRLGLADIPDLVDIVEGDRVYVTVVKTRLDICKSRKNTNNDPEPLSTDDRVNTGRFIHTQDGGYHHGRAMIIVQKVKPASFAGKLALTVWDATAKSSNNPRSELFEQEIAADGQASKPNPYEFDHKANFPDHGLKLWAQGKAGTVSGALRDTEIRLGVKDHIRMCGRVALTVVRFKNFKADIPSTPANTERKKGHGLGDNHPVPRHEFIIDGTDDKHFDDDFAENEPLVLVENSIKDSDKINLSVEIEPANIDVSWGVVRDYRTADPKGDHADIIALPGNSDDPGLSQDGGDKLKASMTANAVGSFHVCPYIDCNGNGKFDHSDNTGVRIDREPFITMNIVLIRVQGFTNNTVTNSAAGTNGIETQNIGGIDYPVNISTGDFNATGNDAIHMKAIARLIGGGQDGKRGLDCIFGGWTNNVTDCATSPTGQGLDITHHHQKPPPSPMPVLPPPAEPVHRLACYFEMNGAKFGGAVLDAGAYGPGGSQGTGGNTATSTKQSNDCPVNKTDDASGIGQKWEIENVDSPGFGIEAFNPTEVDAQLILFKFNIDFRCDLVFWTNIQKVSDSTNAPACRLYSSVSTNTWTVRCQSSFDKDFNETQDTPIAVAVTQDPDATRLAEPVDGIGLETRQPDTIDNLKTNQPIP